MALQDLKVEDLEIKVSSAKGKIELTCRGAIHSVSPDEYLNPYFDDVVDEAVRQKSRVVCNFVELEYMNSASIPPLIALLRQLAENKIKGEFIYDSKRKVQTASFRALDVIARKSDYTVVKGV